MKQPNLTDTQRDLIERSLKAIEAEPQKFDMTHWAQTKDCGTVCCFAGQVAFQHTGRPIYVPELGRGEIDGRDVEDIAAKALGIGVGFGSEVLFFHSEWPYDFWQQYDVAESDAERAAALRARVEHWLETGE